jgi:hypothetical protein
MKLEAAAALARLDPHEDGRQWSCSRRQRGVDPRRRVARRARVVRRAAMLRELILLEEDGCAARQQQTGQQQRGEPHACLYRSWLARCRARAQDIVSTRWLRVSPGR